jgi:hypothetical protein
MGAYVCVLICCLYTWSWWSLCAHDNWSANGIHRVCRRAPHNTPASNRSGNQWSLVGQRRQSRSEVAADGANQDRKLRANQDRKLPVPVHSCREVNLLSRTVLVADLVAALVVPTCCGCLRKTHMREADQPHEEGSRCLYANQHPWRTWQRHEDGEEATFIKKHRGRIIVFFRWPCALDLSNKIEEVWEN